jgi:deoxyribonuclease V
MQVHKLHSWDVTADEAIALQKRLAGRVDTDTPLPPGWDLIAGADVSYNRDDPTTFASVVVWRRSTGEVVEAVGAVGESHFPYVPGLLSFREAPTVLAAFARLPTRPDVVMCDGQGIAHPRRLGIASHIGLWLELPTLGCAKSLLCGRYAEPGPEPGDTSPLTHRGEVIGTVLRTKKNVTPVFVSPGHRIDQGSAVAVVRACGRKYRLPEPTRLAHLRVNELRRGRTPE